MQCDLFVMQKMRGEPRGKEPRWNWAEEGTCYVGVGPAR